MKLTRDEERKLINTVRKKEAGPAEEKKRLYEKLGCFYELHQCSLLWPNPDVLSLVYKNVNWHSQGL